MQNIDEDKVRRKIANYHHRNVRNNIAVLTDQISQMANCERNVFTNCGRAFFFCENNVITFSLCGIDELRFFRSFVQE